MVTMITEIWVGSGSLIRMTQQFRGSAEQVANKIEREFANGRIVGLVEGAERIELVSKENEGRITRFRGLIDGTNRLTIKIF